MTTVIVHTDFSVSARNALGYTCALADKQHVQLVLLHIYTIPEMYTGDGIALTTVRHAFAEAEERLEEEVDWIHHNYSSISITSRAVVGDFMVSLREQVNAFRPALVVIGAGMHSDDLWSFDADIVDAFIDLSVPVLTIPRHVTYAPVHKVCFACNLRYAGPRMPVAAVKEIVRLTGAQLYIVFVAPAADKGIAMQESEAFIKETFAAYNPCCYSLSEADIVENIGHFINEYNIDLLQVVPRRQGIYDSLFHKTNTRALARINTIPVIALREER